MSNVPLLYRQKPMFGIDIGHDSVKVVQIAYDKHRKSLNTLGYGFNTFSSNAVRDGRLVDHNEIAKSVYSLLTELLVGGVTTNRVAAALPVSRTFTRILHLPHMNRDELEEAVRTEAEQYVPLPPEEIYIDFEVNHKASAQKDEQYEVLMVAAPKDIVDSYIQLFSMLNLEIGLFETSLISSVRGANYTQVLKPDEIEDSAADDNPEGKHGATLLVDLGASSTDLSIFDSTIRVTGTVDSGGEDVTAAISKELDTPRRQAYTIKSRYGMGPGKHQKQVVSAIEPVFANLVREIKKMQRYYKSRSLTQSDITRLIMLGGGANLPGLADYLKEKTGLNTTICNPWEHISFQNLQPPHQLEMTTYTTAVGLSLAGLEQPRD